MVINFFGDVVIQNADNIAISERLRALMLNADYNVVNFEAPIRIPNQKKVHKSGPAVCQDEKAPSWLIKNGINVVSLANNHIFDYGNESYDQTMKRFCDKVILIGAGTYEDAYKPAVLEKNGIRVAVFSMAEMQFGIFSEKRDGYGCAWVKDDSIEQRIRDAKKDSDFVVVLVHAGLECETIPLPEWRASYRHLIDCGCDVVIGGHTHTAQGYEIYQGSPIFYSVGNFCFEENLFASELWNLGGAVSLKIEKGCLEWRFLLLLFDGREIDLLDATTSETKIAKLNESLNDGYQKRINDICLRKLDDYNNLNSMAGYLHIDKKIIKTVARFLLGRCDDIHMLNTLQCETHRWCFERALKLKNKLL